MKTSMLAILGCIVLASACEKVAPSPQGSDPLVRTDKNVVQHHLTSNNELMLFRANGTSTDLVVVAAFEKNVVLPFEAAAEEFSSIGLFDDGATMWVRSEKSKTIYYFGVSEELDGQRISDATADVANNGFKVTFIPAYGISRLPGNWEVTALLAPNVPSAFDLLSSGMTKTQTCQSGGPGATSCSIGGGGCSVSCGRGPYYACCNVNSCKCVAY